MNTNTLNLIPDYQDSPCGSQTIWNTVHGKLNNPFYLHGKLQSEAGFDIVYRLRGENWEIPLIGESGELEVEIHINKGEYKIVKAVAVWWITRGMARGLIVALDDEEAYSYAKKKQKEKSFII